MCYLLLTGGTGLLGTYLLRDLLGQHQQVAVVARSGVVETARQRIDTILAFWERSLGYALPRPPVLEGDICQTDLGLDTAAVHWVKRNCTAVLHNAASLSFEADVRTGEPYRSNVEGTRNLLALCRKTGLRRFHHVSTAYVCGRRTGRVLESELDVGQVPGNDYEKSKIQAETMVREADFLDPPTIYRPAIIIGDSATGYTTTFHGFYTPLKIGQALVSRFGITDITGEPLMAALGLSGQERKNLVPVDWISRVITYLYSRPEHHGRTYHVAPARPTPAMTLCQVIEHALAEYARTSVKAKPEIPNLAELQQAFTSQMGVYRAYWRDDPEFDATNTIQAAPHLPCPEVGFDLLMRTATFALSTNFGWPKPPAVLPEFDVAEHLGGVLPMQGSLGPARPELPRVGMQVNGPGGGQWTLLVDSGRPVAAEVGLADRPRALLYLNSNTYARCVRGELTAREATQLGYVVTEGDSLSRDRLLEAFAAVVGRNGPSDAPAATLSATGASGT
jgi:nucleoside-diphosphate-sugar epimerase